MQLVNQCIYCEAGTAGFGKLQLDTLQLRGLVPVCKKCFLAHVTDEVPEFDIGAPVLDENLWSDVWLVGQPCSCMPCAMRARQPAVFAWRSGLEPFISRDEHFLPKLLETT